MSASRPISVASIDSDDIYPDYEGFGSINMYSANGTIKTIRMGQCIRAPSIKDLLRKRTSEAYEKGIFGAPSFVSNNKVFWGQHRIEFAIKEASK